MKKYLGMSLSIGIVAGIWFFVANSLGLQPWPAYIGWSVFFWEGADFDGVKRSFPCIVLGAVLGVITFYCIGLLGDIPGPGVTLLLASLMVMCLAFTMTIAQTSSLFRVASATFIGASHYFGLRGYLPAMEGFLNAAFVTSVGLILGMISVKLGAVFESKIGE
ncbi:MAG: DUF1097 domain-containing protein [Tissierellia bacterium]|nr:DUF1097 domain-containing protein [Tissierellia bacterium]